MIAQIYINETVIPYLTLEFQEKICREVADLKGYTITDLIKGPENLQTVISKKDYNTNAVLFVYNLSIFGETLPELIDYIEKLSKRNIELISCFDNFALKTFGLDPQDNIFLTTIIALNIKNIELWKELQKNYIKQ